MKKLNLFIYAFFFFFLTSNAQIEKGYWLQGGNIALVFENSKITTDVSDYEAKTHYLIINPNLGYFVADRFAIGINLNLQVNFPDKNVSSSSGYGFDIGPFVRYYYLNHNKPYNIYSQIGYNYGGGLNENFEKWVDINKLSLSNGFCYFLNESVAIESSLNYIHRNVEDTANFKSISNNFNLSIGFQIHLIKKQ